MQAQLLRSRVNTGLFARFAPPQKQRAMYNHAPSTRGSKRTRVAMQAGEVAAAAIPHTIGSTVKVQGLTLTDHTFQVSCPVVHSRSPSSLAFIPRVFVDQRTRMRECLAGATGS